MSWSGGGEIFDATIKRVWELNLGWYATQEIAETLYKVLSGRGWDTQEESLGIAYPEMGPVVAMFNALGYVAQGQYDSEGHSIIRVPCGNCHQLVFFYWDDDRGEVIETHVLDVSATPQTVCPYSGKGRTGH